MKAYDQIYDTSNYAMDHPLFSNKNKKVMERFKNKLGGKIMTKLVGLKPEMYSYAGKESEW